MLLNRYLVLSSLSCPWEFCPLFLGNFPRVVQLTAVLRITAHISRWFYNRCTGIQCTRGLIITKLALLYPPLGYLKKKEGKEGINSEVSQQETTVHSLSGNQATVLWNFSWYNKRHHEDRNFGSSGFELHNPQLSSVFLCICSWKYNCLLGKQSTSKWIPKQQQASGSYCC